MYSDQREGREGWGGGGGRERERERESVCVFLFLFVNEITKYKRHTSVLPVDHSRHSTTFGALTRKHVEHAEKHVEHAEKHVELAGTGRRPPKQQHNANVVTGGRQKARDSSLLFWPVLFG